MITHYQIQSAILKLANHHGVHSPEGLVSMIEDIQARAVWADQIPDIALLDGGVVYLAIKDASGVEIYIFTQAVTGWVASMYDPDHD